MLKRITLNGRRIPVPVPIRELSEAIAWVQKYLMRPDHAITRIELNGVDVEFSNDGECRVYPLKLDEGADLRIKIDSPAEISLQTLDVLRNLSSAVGRNLKPIAVQLWEHKGIKLPPETVAIIDDLGLMQELLDHVLLLLDKRVDATNVCSIQTAINKAVSALHFAIQGTDWKAAAKVLLNQVETPALELGGELTSVEKVIFELLADRSGSGNGNGERPKTNLGPSAAPNR